MPLNQEAKNRLAERLMAGEDVEIKLESDPEARTGEDGGMLTGDDTAEVAPGPAPEQQGVDLSVDSQEVIDALLQQNTALTLELTVARLQLAKLT